MFRPILVRVCSVMVGQFVFKFPRSCLRLWAKPVFMIAKNFSSEMSAKNFLEIFSIERIAESTVGAGTKLPHNVMGLIGVANSSDGDLRPGLPVQMIEVHDPVRLLVIVEHFPEIEDFQFIVMDAKSMI